MNERSTARALKWIVDIINKEKIPFQLIGGLAARNYGATRKLADIDIGLAISAVDRLLPEIGRFITYGPAQYKDQEWDVTEQMTVIYEGQEIDLPRADTMKIFNKKEGVWELFPFDISLSVYANVLGLHIPVISKEMLVSYKSKIGRTVDLLDVTEIAERSNSV